MPDTLSPLTTIAEQEVAEAPLAMADFSTKYSLVSLWLINILFELQQKRRVAKSQVAVPTAETGAAWLNDWVAEYLSDWKTDWRCRWHFFSAAAFDRSTCADSFCVRSSSTFVAVFAVEQRLSIINDARLWALLNLALAMGIHCSIALASRHSDHRIIWEYSVNVCSIAISAQPNEVLAFDWSGYCSFSRFIADELLKIETKTKFTVVG